MPNTWTLSGDTIKLRPASIPAFETISIPKGISTLESMKFFNQFTETIKSMIEEASKADSGMLCDFKYVNLNCDR